MFSRVIIAVLVLTVLASYASAQEDYYITLYTKVSEPFSNGESGYSIDYLEQLFTSVYGNHWSMDIIVLGSISDVLEAVSNSTQNSTHYAIGAADITITATREEYVDFLPAYFASGLQVMTHAEEDLTLLILNLVSDFFVTCGVVVFLILFVIYTLSPIVWYFEMRGGTGKIPIFVDWKTRKAKEHFINLGCTRIETSAKVKNMAVEIFNAIRWTSLTLFGTDTGYPTSTVAIYLRSVLKITGLVILVTLNAAITTLFTNASETTAVGSYADLSGTTVCTVAGGTAVTYLDANNVGFQLVTYESTDTLSDLDVTFDAFWDKDCDAVVYDYPALRSEIANHDQDGAADTVGNLLNTEYYGFALGEGNVNYDELQLATIELNNDITFLSALETKYLAEVEVEESDGNSELPAGLVITLCVLGSALLAFFVALLYRNYEDQTEAYNEIKNAKFDRDYADDYQQLLADEENNEDVYHDVGWIADQKLLPMMIRSLRVLYEMELQSQGRNLTHISGMRTDGRRLSSIGEGEAPLANHRGSLKKKASDDVEMQDIKISVDDMTHNGEAKLSMSNQKVE